MSCTTTTLLALLITLVVVLALVVLPLWSPAEADEHQAPLPLDSHMRLANPDAPAFLCPPAHVGPIVGVGRPLIVVANALQMPARPAPSRRCRGQIPQLVRVKVGEAGHLTTRQRGYQRCNLGQTHFWLFCFYPKQRKAAEKMCHFLFLADAPRALLDCSCGTTHTEYWWLRDLGSFAEVEERIRDVLAHLGQPDLVRHDLRDVWLLSLLGFLSVFLSCSIVAGETQRENVPRACPMYIPAVNR
ncbi:hypothetical protein C8F04DRAFT_1205036 [Mycena alexandri]|uniref:Uncharacterized protein n=1 Tax=Mycena alexandri TaxID=1745969 RepID=A0AAD6RYV2_9AGAR|nr:hypothetical protein C8F04DRAFT_1205036 [Mycena alexandri]